MRLSILFVLTMLMTGCKNDLTFDSEKWKERQDLEYPYRELMVSDIIVNNRFVGQPYDQVIDSLGQPENYVDKKDNELWYIVIENYGTDIDPVYTKHLTLTLGSDSTVVKVEIKEWRH